MLRGLRALGLVVVMVSGLTLAGCAAPAPVQTPTVRTPASASAPAFASQAQAVAAAKRDFTKYVAVGDEIFADGGQHPERLKPLVTESDYVTEGKDFADIRSLNIRTAGATKVTAFKLQQVDLRTGAMTAYVCYDLTDVRVHDKSNRDVTPKTRIDKQSLIASLQWRDGSYLIGKVTQWLGHSIC